MDRDIPNYNPLVNNKIQHKNLQLHYQRLNNIKSSHYSRGSLSAYHNTNRKAHLKQQQRKTQIERDNVTLFNKMVNIMKRDDPCNKPNIPHNRSKNRPSTQLSRIQEQNRTMYERLERQKPTIDNKKLMQDRKKNENILKFLGKYSAHSLQNMQPVSLRTSQASRMNQNRTQVQQIRSNHYLEPTQMNGAMEMRTKARYNPYEQQEVDQDEIKLHMQIANRGRKAYSSAFSSKQHKIEPNQDSIPSAQPSRVQSRLPPRSAKDIILFKAKKQIQGEIFEISIVRSHNSYQIRAKESSGFEHESLKIIMDEQEGHELLERTSYNYKAIINRITIKNGQLAMCNYEQQSQDEQQQHIVSEQPKKLDSYKMYSKQTSQQFNASHISQQNDEESYRPNESVNRDFSPPKATKRVDSLGQEQQDKDIREDPHEEESYKQEEKQEQNEQNTEEKQEEEQQEKQQDSEESKQSERQPNQQQRKPSEDDPQLDFNLSVPAAEQSRPEPPKENYNFAYEQSLELSATKAALVPGVASYEEALEEQIL